FQALGMLDELGRLLLPRSPVERNDPVVIVKALDEGVGLVVQVVPRQLAFGHLHLAEADALCLEGRQKRDDGVDLVSGDGRWFSHALILWVRSAFRRALKTSSGRWRGLRVRELGCPQ